MVGIHPRATVYYKAQSSLDSESVRAVSREITELLKRLYNYETFSRDVRYLHRQGITQKALSSALNITGRSLQYWMKGKVTPRNLYCFLMVREIAKRLREKEQAQKAAGLTPHVVSNAP